MPALNFTDAFHRLYVELHRADRDERSEAFVFDAEFELAARGEEVADPMCLRREIIYHSQA